jgi:hypothetical protein
MVESAFSSFKRVFGEYITSVKWMNIVNELLLKASIYNLSMKMNKNKLNQNQPEIQLKRNSQSFDTPL